MIYLFNFAFQLHSVLLIAEVWPNKFIRVHYEQPENRHSQKYHSINEKSYYCIVFVGQFIVFLCISFKNYTSLYLVEGLAWWDWPFTWWTNQLLSFSA